MLRLEFSGSINVGALASHTEAYNSLVEAGMFRLIGVLKKVPVVYATIYCTFFVTTSIEKGKSVLINVGSGGIGFAATRVTFAFGFEVYTTVRRRTDEKAVDSCVNQMPRC